MVLEQHKGEADALTRGKKCDKKSSSRQWRHVVRGHSLEGWAILLLKLCTHGEGLSIRIPVHKKADTERQRQMMESDTDDTYRENDRDRHGEKD